MTRSIFVAALALTPALLHAQATSPAPAANTIQARLSAPAAIKTAADKKSDDKKTEDKSVPSTVRVSTGVVAPKLIKSVDLIGSTGIKNQLLANGASVVVTLVVDANGLPTQIALDKGANPIIDKEVLESVAKYRFQPGTLDGQPFALPVRLAVTVQHGVQY